MFGIGTWELLIILVLALVILGPQKLPELARQVGKTVQKLRRTADEVRREIDIDGVRSELLGDPELKKLEQELDVRGEIRKAMGQLQDPPPLPGPGSGPGGSAPPAPVAGPGSDPPAGLPPGGGPAG
ncbi:MAG TPA: Sec-independent protein translocase protein TatB [Myxococcota bacterium]|nr:Sec-independent protein translocase protein TatB [Myxococcota bacterium]HRY91868.1 Sec-independent protein translocase protein TatB [Myxococcota bacterium]HSA23070.1 Sec-independent protein translocase protein TatB [Myxococcota bacterium]